jgi:hypothetical protein
VNPARQDPAEAGAEARDDGGLPRHGTVCRRGVGGRSVGGGGGAVDRRGTRPVWIGYSTGSDWRGVVPSGSGAPLATPSPRVGGGRTRSPSTRPPPIPHPPHEVCTEGGGSGEEEGAPRPATTDEARLYLDLFF